MFKQVLGILLTFFLGLPGSSFASEPVVDFFSPQNEVKGVRQVTVRFSEQMAPFGDPRLVEPFDIACPEKGRQRWADGKNWIYDFERDLPAGVICEFSLKPGLRTLAGSSVGGQKKFSFTTGGPAIRRANPYEGSEYIDEEQIFVLWLDAEAKEKTVLENAYCSIDGVGERVGLRIVTGGDRKQALSSVRGRYWRQEEKKLNELVVQCKQRFPNEARVTLVWGKGIESVSGVPTSQDQKLPYRARPPFTATFSCQRENPNADCIPFLPMTLQLSAPVSAEYASKITLIGPGNTVYRPRIQRDGSDVKSDSISHVSFAGPFPETSAFTITVPSGMKDDAGRELSNRDRFPLAVRTAEYPPLAKFSSRFGIIEKADPLLPVTLRNLEPEVKAQMLDVAVSKGLVQRTTEGVVDTAKKVGKAITSLFSDKPAVEESVTGKVKRIDSEQDVIAWLRRVGKAGRRESVFAAAELGASITDFTVPKPGGKKAFEVVGIPLKNTGVYVVELQSAILGASLLGEQKPVYVPTAAVVTNLAAHFKWGRESSIVWVTRLDTAEPVPNAAITIRDCEGKPRWDGRTNADGIARLGEGIIDPKELPVCAASGEAENDLYMDYEDTKALHGMDRGLFVFARTEDDMTFVHSSWSEGIEPWRFSLPHESHRGATIGHTIFDRTLLRAGETVSMKHIIRRHTLAGFAPAPKLPNTVMIRHQGSDQRYEFPLAWDANGIAETLWKIPPDAKLGHYEVVLLEKKVDKEKKRTAIGGYEAGDEDYFRPEGWPSGSFRVEEFRVPLMKGIIQPPKEPAVNARELRLDLFVGYLSGGGAGDLPVKLRTLTQPHSVGFEDFEGYTFANGEIKEEVTHRGRGKSYWEDEEEGPESEQEQESKKEKVRSTDLVLDRTGALRTTVGDLPKLTLPKDLVAEMEFRDPNGEVKTVSSHVPLWPSKVLVGIKPDSWLVSKDAFKFYLAVADVAGKPVRGRKVSAEFFQRMTFSHRKRLVGGFYAFEHVTETKRLGSVCEGVTNEKGIVICETKSAVSGNVIIQARTADDDGNVSVSHRDTWVAGGGEWWFDVSNTDRIDVLPEKKRYEPGELAKFQVRMPFREATALVTVEREGVAETFIRKLTGTMPVVEVPVKTNYAPNIFVSVLVVRGRLGDVKPTALVDLGRPAFKLGIAEISVGWKGHELKVSVSAERNVYKIREKAAVLVKVRTADNAVPPKGSEVAIAAVDEGLLQLMPNASWNLLEAMMGRRGCEVKTSTAQMQVVGKRHYGLKALPAGGGGGSQTTRELFDSLLLWKGRVKLNDAGEAKVEIPLNDSLTSFRIVAVASGGIGFFGSGGTSIRTTQDLMLMSGLPPVVREGDKFKAGFLLRNASDRKMMVDIKASSANVPALENKVEIVGPGEAREIFWDAAVPLNVDSLTWDVTATERNGAGVDKIRIKQKVVEAVQARVYQATITQIEKPQTMTIEKPKDALPGKGGVNVSFRKKLSNGMGGVIWFMKHYPYTCMEQKTSRAVALRDEALWKTVIAELPAHLDGDGLVKYFPTCIWGSDSLTAYMLQIAHEAGWTIPENIKSRMENGLRGFIEGRVIRWSSLPTADVSIRKMAALEALSRNNKAEPKLLGSITLEPNLWPTSAVIDWMNVLMRVPAMPERDQRLKEAEQIIRSRINFQGTTMGFSTEKSDYLWWLMISGDVNSVRSVLTFLDMDLWKEDMPRLVRGAIGRQYHGAWSTTIANAWGVMAMEKFSKKFESVPVTGVSSVKVEDATKQVDWKAAAEGSGVMFGWPVKKADLSISHQGTGRPWATIQSIAAIPLKEPFSSGYTIKKTVTPIEQKKKGQWSRGDVARVKLELEAQSDMTWVVVNDPIPAGSSILGGGLGGDSSLMTRGEKGTGWAWPVFSERTFTAYRAYYEFVAKGTWSLEYTVRLNTSGSFELPETRVEALYAPEMFGESPNAGMTINP
jgi:uncharacterized protein YfaS (alpha-2-macroglobulin family)